MIGVLRIAFVLLLASCSRRVVQEGKASYYADKFVGRKTASGAVYRHGKRTAAHKTLPFGTKVTVLNLKNGKRVKLRINDRGPFVAGRIIDVSKKGARKLGMLRQGVTEVRLSYRSNQKEAQ
jgi:rare lipoprotein A